MEKVFRGLGSWWRRWGRFEVGVVGFLIGSFDVIFVFLFIFLGVLVSRF